MNKYDIFPKPKAYTAENGTLILNGCIKADSTGASALPSFLHMLRSFGFCEGDGNLILKYDNKLGAEGYDISVSDTIATVSAGDNRGFSYAAATLLQLLTDDLNVPCLHITDEPCMKIRGAHFYLPPADGIDEFCRILDALAYLKYNTLFLEIGGGVEYKSHPEINTEWRRFCRKTREFPGGPQGLQGSEGYWKDSTHIELAGGGVLSQEQLMKIVNHARLLGIEVIPEIQALSHSYYLTLAHREIAERPFELYPDSYCPMNDESYALYFDIARELHGLIGFSKVSIGHDEIRVLGECPRCREHSGSELLAYEINKLYDFYSGMGVKLFMWGEALQNFQMSNGKRMGDALSKASTYGRRHFRPSTYEAIDKIPKDITVIDWCYLSSFDSEKEFTDRDIPEIYGNFHGTGVCGWDIRSRRKNVLGAEVSTWCVSDEDEVGRNGWFFELAFSSAVLWRDDFCDDMRDLFFEQTNAVMPHIRSIVRGEKQNKGRNESIYPFGKQPITLTHPKEQISALLSESSVSFGISTDTPVIFLQRQCEQLTFLHAADIGNNTLPREYTWFFRDRSSRVLAHYSVEYEDSLVLSVPIEFGVQIGDICGGFDTHMPDTVIKNVEDESDSGDISVKITEFKPTSVVIEDEWIHAVTYFADAYSVKSKQARTVYGWTWQNPRPEIAVKSVTLYPDKHAERDGKAPILLFGIIA